MHVTIYALIVPRLISQKNHFTSGRTPAASSLVFHNHRPPGHSTAKHSDDEDYSDDGKTDDHEVTPRWGTIYRRVQLLERIWRD